MTPFDGRPAGHKGDPLQDIGAQPENVDRLRIKSLSAFVKRPMRKRTGDGIVTFVGVRSGRATSQVACNSPDDLRSHND